MINDTEGLLGLTLAEAKKKLAGDSRDIRYLPEGIAHTCEFVAHRFTVFFDEENIVTYYSAG